MNKDISAIIAFRNKEDRLKNLEFVLFWLDGISFVKEIILVEQDIKPRCQNLFNSKISKLVYIFSYNPNSFNKSYAYNLGSRYSSNEYLLFNDSDIFYDFSIIHNELLNWNFDAMNPYDSVIDLGMKESENLRKGDEPLLIENKSRNGICFAGGAFFIKKNIYEKLGGFNEDFFSWGGEDDYFSLMLEKYTINLITVKQKAYHLFHERDICSTSENPYYNSNILILESLKVLNVEQLYLINLIRSKTNANLEKFVSTERGNYTNFKEALGFRESSNNYSVVNSKNFMGKYQMGFERLQDLGIVSFNGTEYIWENGLSQDFFLNNHVLQDIIFDLHFADVLNKLIKECSMFINFNLNDSKLTLSGMFAGVHLLGFNALNRRLNFGISESDEYGTPIDEYLEIFSGYDVLGYFN